MDESDSMRRSRYLALLMVLCIGLSSIATGQEERVWDNMSLGGYVKSLTTVFVPPGDTNVVVDNLIHNRLDYAWYINEKFTFNASMRNRLFLGGTVNLIPEFYDMLAEDPGFMDLNILWFNSKGAAAQTAFDRLNIDFQSNKWQVIVGRHRINWGVNLVWNPNDIFNSYSYFDFDYEERIGTDAILGRYYINETSSAELIYAPQDSLKRSTFAGMYKTLVSNYDIQVFGGYLSQQITFGGAWSGDIKGAGFRGEFSVFLPSEELPLDNQFVGAIDIDYTFPNTLYLHGSYLFNSVGINASMGDYANFFIGNNISAQALSPAMHNIFAQAGWNPSPIVRLTFATWINPTDGSLFLGPTCNWSVAENFEILLNVQGFIGKEKTLFGGYGSFYYLRTKYSF